MSKKYWYLIVFLGLFLLARVRGMGFFQGLGSAFALSSLYFIFFGGKKRVKMEEETE